MSTAFKLVNNFNNFDNFTFIPQTTIQPCNKEVTWLNWVQQPEIASCHRQIIITAQYAIHAYKVHSLCIAIHQSTQGCIANAKRECVFNCCFAGLDFSRECYDEWDGISVCRNDLTVPHLRSTYCSEHSGCIQFQCLLLLLSMYNSMHEILPVLLMVTRFINTPVTHITPTLITQIIKNIGIYYTYSS